MLNLSCCKQKWGLAAQYTGQVGGKENLLYFGCWQPGDGGTGWTSVQGPTPPLPNKQGVRAFVDRGGQGGSTCRNSTVISNSHLQIDHQWSDQHHLDCFRYS